MNMNCINTEWGMKVRDGLNLPTTAISRILNGKHMIEEIEKEDIKSKIQSFISTRDKTTLSDIAERFSLNIDKTMQILDEMEKEERIKQL